MSVITDKPDISNLSPTIEDDEGDCECGTEKAAFMAGFRWADRDSVVTPWKAYKMWLRERDEP